MTKRDEWAADLASSLLDPQTPAPTGAKSPSEAELAAATAVPWALETHEVIGTMALLGDPVPTGAQWFDREMRHGGAPPGKVIIVGGPPFAGKSQLFAQFMFDMSPKAPCYTLMADAGWQDVCVSIAAMLGVEKADTEKQPHVYGPRVGELMGERSLIHVNPRHPKATLTGFFDWVASRQDSCPIVFLDSAQVMRLGIDEGDQTHEQMVGLLCQAFATRYRAIVFLSSKANRAFYRNRDKKDNTTAISSFMGGDYEYTGDAAIVLSRPDKTTGLVNLEWPKNRLGNPYPDDVPLRWDPNSHRLVSLDDAQVDAANRERKIIEEGPVKEKIRKAIRGMQPLSKNAICEAASVGRSPGLAAINSMIADKQLTAIPTEAGSGFRYALSYESSTTPSTTQDE